MTTDIASVKALTFDVFGTVTDWRGGYEPAMARVRRGDLPWTRIDTLHRMILDDLLEKHNVTGLTEAEKDDLQLTVGYPVFNGRGQLIRRLVSPHHPGGHLGRECCSSAPHGAHRIYQRHLPNMRSTLVLRYWKERNLRSLSNRRTQRFRFLPPTKRCAVF